MAQGAFVNLVRKYCASGKALGLFRSGERGGLSLRFYGGGDSPKGIWTILVEAGKPPLMSLVGPDGVVYCRMSSQGTFTKRWTLPTPLPEPGDQERLVLPWIPVEKDADPSSQETIGEQDQGLSEPQRALRDRVARRVKTLRKALAAEESQVPKRAEIEGLAAENKWLQEFGYLVHEGMFELKLTPEQTGLADVVLIPLDATESLGAQLNARFQQWRKMQKGAEIGHRRLSAMGEQLGRLQHILEALRGKVLGPHELDVLGEEFKRLGGHTGEGGPAGPKAAPPKTFREFMSSQGRRILLGRTAEENDRLTKNARSNDLWLHVAGMAGTHVVIPTAGKNQEVDPQTLREAAILAVHFSKLKTNFGGEVHITQRRHLKKGKGSAPGTWQVLRSENMHVRYSQAEVDGIFKRQVL